MATFVSHKQMVTEISLSRRGGKRYATLLKVGSPSVHSTNSVRAKKGESITFHGRAHPTQNYADGRNCREIEDSELHLLLACKDCIYWH